MQNVVALVGRLTKDPEVRVIGQETKVANFTLAVNRPFKDENNEQVADFINCQAWKNQADFMEKYVGKGQLVSVQGSIRTRTYDKDGVTHYVTEVNVDMIQSLEKGKPQTEEDIKKQWTDEWNKRKGSLKAGSKEYIALKNELTKKYQARIDGLTKSNSTTVIEDDLPF